MEHFSTDSRFYQISSRIGANVLLSILWILASLPIITVGAATSALYYCAVKNLRKDEGSIVRDFWGAFRSDFRQSTAVILVFLLLFGAAYVLGRGACALLGTSPATVWFVWLALGLLGIGWLHYALTCIARFQSCLTNILKNTLVLSLIHLPKTLSISVLFGVTIVGFILLLPRSIGAVLFLPALTSLLISFLLEPIYQKYIDSLGEKREENV